MCSTVEAAVDGVLASVGGPAEEIVALVDLADRVQAALVERVGVFDAAEGWAADGDFSFACWLRARADVTRAESLQLGRFARTLRTMPLTEMAVADGKVSVAKARLLAGVINERTEERFFEQEGFLLDQVQGLSVDHAKVALDYWKRMADTDGPDPDDPTRNWARVSVGFQGRWNVEADLDPASGAILKAVLDAIVDRMHQDVRFNDLAPGENTCGRRTAEGFMEMVHRSSGVNPDQPAVHPDIVVVVPLSSLTAGEPDPFDPPTLSGGGPLTMAEVARLALLGTVSTMTVDEKGRPLNLGRKQRLATSDQWIALTVRDRCCVAPGCDRPAGWCQAHVRHEALSTVRDERTRLQAVAAACRSWEQPDLGGTRSGGSSSDNDGTAWHCQTHRVRQARRNGVRMQKPMVEPPKWHPRLEPGGSGPVSSARSSRHGVGDSASVYERSAGGHGEGLRRSRGEAAGEELGAYPVERLMVNVGTTARLPYLPPSQGGSGKACRRSMAWWWDGGFVVVRGRESRSHGEGTQQDRGCGTVMPGGRR